MEQPNKFSPYFNTMGFSSSKELKEAIKETLEKAIADGDGKDGIALDMVIGACFADGEIYTDGECLDIVGHIIEVWNQIGDEEEAS
jgi:hypothetical protein